MEGIIQVLWDAGPLKVVGAIVFIILAVLVLKAMCSPNNMPGGGQAGQPGQPGQPGQQGFGRTQTPPAGGYGTQTPPQGGYNAQTPPQGGYNGGPNQPMQ